MTEMPRDERNQPKADPSQAATDQDPWSAVATEHQGTCPYPCPLCMGVAFVDQMSPEVGEHLVAAGKELMAAAKKFMESVASEQQRSERVEKIDLDED